MKICLVALGMIAMGGCLAACGEWTDMERNSSKEIAAEEKVREFVIDAEELERGGNKIVFHSGYSEAFSEAELEMLEEKARKFYEEEFSYELLSLKLAEDSSSLYENYPEYEQGNILIFLAETTHAGEGVYRFFVFGRKDTDDEWERIDEGYE